MVALATWLTAIFQFLLVILPVGRIESARSKRVFIDLRTLGCPLPCVQSRRKGTFTLSRTRRGYQESRLYSCATNEASLSASTLCKHLDRTFQHLKECNARARARVESMLKTSLTVFTTTSVAWRIKKLLHVSKNSNVTLSLCGNIKNYNQY